MHISVYPTLRIKLLDVLHLLLNVNCVNNPNIVKWYVTKNEFDGQAWFELDVIESQKSSIIIIKGTAFIAKIVWVTIYFHMSALIL